MNNILNINDGAFTLPYSNFQEDFQRRLDYVDGTLTINIFNLENSGQYAFADLALANINNITLLQDNQVVFSTDRYSKISNINLSIDDSTKLLTVHINLGKRFYSDGSQQNINDIDVNEDFDRSSIDDFESRPVEN